MHACGVTRRRNRSYNNRLCILSSSCLDSSNNRRNGRDRNPYFACLGQAIRQVQGVGVGMGGGQLLTEIVAGVVGVAKGVVVSLSQVLSVIERMPVFFFTSVTFSPA